MWQVLQVLITMCLREGDLGNIGVSTPSGSEAVFAMPIRGIYALGGH